MKIVEELLKNIYSYYPIGMNSFINKYEGQKQLRKIIENKINALIAKQNSPWTNLVYDIEKHYPGKVFDMAYLQFPSYQAVINFNSIDNDEYNSTHNLIVVISLLCSYYTIFFESDYRFKAFNSSPELTNYKIFSLNSDKKNSSIDLVAIKSEIEKNFDAHSFISHKILFDYKINGGIPYSKTEENLTFSSFPIYSYLFDSHLLLNNVQVLD